MRYLRPLGTAWSVFVAVAVVCAFQAFSGEDSGEHPEQFRITVLDVLDDHQATVKQIRIECVPESRARLTSHMKGGGGEAALTGIGHDKSKVAAIVVTVFADHVQWEAGNVDALKFILVLSGNGGKAVMSDTGPMDDGTQLSDHLKLSVKSGAYKYGTPVPILQFKDTRYSLTVTAPDSN